MPGERYGFVADAFHQAAITSYRVGIVIDDIIAVPGIQKTLSLGGAKLLPGN